MHFNENVGSVCKTEYSAPEIRVLKICIEKNLLDASNPGAEIDPGDPFGD